MGKFALALWIVAGVGWYLGAHVDPGAYNMAIGVGIAALLFTLAWVWEMVFG